MSSQIDLEQEKKEVARVVRLNIEWAHPEKDKVGLYSTMAKDSSLFMFQPDSRSTIIGFEAMKKLTEEFFMHEDFRADGSDIRDMRVNISNSGDVAWYSAILDDWGEWKGQPYRWKNVRWTGVLEKLDGKWLIRQMHLSFPSDAQDDSDTQDSASAGGQ